MNIRPHNPKVAGPNPASATKEEPRKLSFSGFFLCYSAIIVCLMCEPLNDAVIKITS